MMILARVCHCRRASASLKPILVAALWKRRKARVRSGDVLAPVAAADPDVVGVDGVTGGGDEKGYQAPEIDIRSQPAGHRGGTPAGQVTERVAVGDGGTVPNLLSCNGTTVGNEPGDRSSLGAHRLLNGCRCCRDTHAWSRQAVSVLSIAVMAWWYWSDNQVADRCR